VLNNNLSLTHMKFNYMFTVILKVVVEMMLLKYLTKEEIPFKNNAYGGK